jgi:hypothetical protein
MWPWKRPKPHENGVLVWGADWETWEPSPTAGEANARYVEHCEHPALLPASAIAVRLIVSGHVADERSLSDT